MGDSERAIAALFALARCSPAPRPPQAAQRSWCFVLFFFLWRVPVSTRSPKPLMRRRPSHGRQCAPTVLFIDQIDALTPPRGPTPAPAPPSDSWILRRTKRSVSNTLVECV
jgi:hypothetical protein